MCVRVCVCVCVRVCVYAYMCVYLKPFSCNVGLKEMRSKEHGDCFDDGVKNICLQEGIGITFFYLLRKFKKSLLLIHVNVIGLLTVEMSGRKFSNNSHIVSLL